MYTEDDEKVEVKEDNSNIKYSDFYTSFVEIDKDKNKKTKGKKKKKEEVKPEPKEESDYNEFYINKMF